MFAIKGVLQTEIFIKLSHMSKAFISSRLCRKYSPLIARNRALLTFKTLACSFVLFLVEGFALYLKHMLERMLEKHPFHSNCFKNFRISQCSTTPEISYKTGSTCSYCCILQKALSYAKIFRSLLVSFGFTCDDLRSRAKMITCVNKHNNPNWV